MYDILLSKIYQSTKHISKVRLYFCLFEWTLLSQLALQVTLVTQFRNDIAITIAVKYIVTLQDVTMI